jgi:hypothetical protein
VHPVFSPLSSLFPFTEHGVKVQMQPYPGDSVYQQDDGAVQELAQENVYQDEANGNRKDGC